MEIAREPPRQPEREETRHRLRVVGPNSIELPEGLAASLGLLEGSELEASFDGDAARIAGNLHSLAKLYLEPTTRCNLSCLECLRRTWGQEPGEMAKETFAAILVQLQSFPHLRTIVFGGFGEPTLHPRLPQMVGELKRARLRVELITNGTLLTRPLAAALAEAGLDRLWISLDGGTEKDLAQIRVGASCAAIVENAKAAARASLERGGSMRLGFNLVAMRGNIAQISAVWELAKDLGADRLMVSNVVPYSSQMTQHTLCALQQCRSDGHSGDPEVVLPQMDLDEATARELLKLLKKTRNVQWGDARLDSGRRMCRFVAQRSSCIRWDGMISPCLALLHPHTEFANGYERLLEPWLLGNVNDRGLPGVWALEAYAAFREKAGRFDFPPCQVCGGCELLSSNREDCFGNQHPACGACLWASGLVQCP
jgi:MoaA/NifB/PqqE/SkfB family radical SAM enzyme